VAGINVDSNLLLERHMAVLHDKVLLRSAFETFYEDMARLCDYHFRIDGLEIELGTGSGFFKKLRPALITSDVRKAEHIDMEVDAQQMPFDTDSVRCVYAINVFHHLPSPELFLAELERVLKRGGGCILIEPHNGFMSALLHRHLHSDEYFDVDAVDWKSVDIGGPLSGANQALAHIVFHRDRQRFEQRFGTRLRVIHEGYVLNALRYLFSGGVNFRPLLPSFMEMPLRLLERAGQVVARHWSLHQVIVITKC
jgi:SAM-dependent methyltransferase